jgi:predicted Zn finger-like uncharacterized protein
MNITCTSCQTICQIADEKVPEKGARANCPNCGQEILIPGRGQEGKSSSLLTESASADFGQTMSYDYREVDQSESEGSALLRGASAQTPELLDGNLYRFLDTATGEAYPFGKPQVSLGRSGADIILGDPEISRRHCMVRVFPDSILLVDTESTNGTFVKGSKIMSARLNFGEPFTLGNTTLKLEVTGMNEGE